MVDGSGGEPFEADVEVQDGKIARVWRKVKVPGHAAEVLEAAKAI